MFAFMVIVELFVRHQEISGVMYSLKNTIPMKDLLCVADMYNISTKNIMSTNHSVVI